MSRSKSKSPSTLRNVAGQATSTTDSSFVDSSKQGKTSRTPSPLRTRQSPTSTSSPRHADSTHSNNEKKGTTPPPPPRISDVIKGDKSENKRDSNKMVKRDRNEFDNKDKNNQSSASSSRPTKRRNEESIHDKQESKRGVSSKSSKLSTNSRFHKDGVSNSVKSSRDNIDNESSSSPSPPPEKDKKIKSLSKNKDLSSGINFRLKSRQKVKEKNPFRIPKKDKTDTGKQANTRTPSPQSFTSEGPLVEFNDGRSPLKERKRHGSKSGSNIQSRQKKSKLSNE